MLPLLDRASTVRPSGPRTAPRTPTARPRARLLSATGAAALLLLTGACGGGSAGAGSAASTTAGLAATSVAPGSTTTTGTTSAASELTVGDAWVKATEGAGDPSMTAAFGLLTNTTDRTLTVVSATTSASDRAELHEMAMVDGAMVMRPKSGGFVIPAGGSTTLQPGAEHVMIMDVGEAIRPGDQVAVTLTLDDGSAVDFTALAKDFAGAEEEYAGTAAAGADMSGAPSSPASHG